MPIKLDPDTKFMSIARRAADGYVAWSRNSGPYEYFGGSKERWLRRLVEVLSQYFDKWDNHIGSSFYHSNDGRGDGGGFTGVICYFGTMPCYLTLRFFSNVITADVWRAEADQGSWRPGKRLYGVAVYDTGHVAEESSFGTILK